MRLIWSGPAVVDLQRIDSWLTSNTSPSIAEAQLECIRRRAGQLRNFPRSGAILTNETRDIRVRGTNYVIVYQVTDRVEILRIRHNREDWRSAE